MNNHPQLHVLREKNSRVFCGYKKRAGATFFHFHSHIELFLVDEGEVDVWVNKHYRRLRRGEMAISLSCDAHRYEPLGEAVATCLIVPVERCADFGSQKLSSPFADSPELYAGISRCCAMIAEQTNTLIRDGCVSVALGLLLQNMDLTGAPAAAEETGITRVLLYLNDHFKDNVTLSSAASALGFNASYLSRKFGETLGIGFNQYVSMLRLREAVRLLERGAPVSFCVYESGFRSARTFYRVFESEFGCTPKQYLNRTAE